LEVSLRLILAPSEKGAFGSFTGPEARSPEGSPRKIVSIPISGRKIKGRCPPTVSDRTGPFGGPAILSPKGQEFFADMMR